MGRERERAVGCQREGGAGQNPKGRIKVSGHIGLEEGGQGKSGGQKRGK